MEARTPRDEASMEEERLRILIADDHAVVREGLGSLLSRVPGFEVIGQASDGPGALEAAESLEPDIVVLDISLPDMTGIDVARKLAEQLPDCRVVILSMYCDESFVSAAMGAGAKAYVLKDEAGEELIDAIRSVASGRIHVSPLATGALVESLRDRGAAPVERGAPQPAAEEEPAERRRASPLSPRELEVLKLVAGGLSTKQVAYELKISPKTADAHRQAIMRKLDIHDVAGLVKYALLHGHIALK